MKDIRQATENIRQLSASSGKAAPTAQAYQEKMTQGPITQEDLVTHDNILEAANTLLAALKDFERVVPSRSMMAEIESGSVDDLRYTLKTLMVPSSLIPEPTRKSVNPKVLKVMRP